MNQDTMKIYNELVSMRTFRRYSNLAGICTNLQHLNNDDHRKAVIAMGTWPDTSGDPIFPVEGESWEYHESACADTLWENPRRLALLEYLIEYFKP